MHVRSGGCGVVVILVVIIEEVDERAQQLCEVYDGGWGQFCFW